MGGSSGGGQSTVQQVSLPDYAQQDYETMMSMGTQLLNRPYQPYQGQRIADPSENLYAAGSGIKDMYGAGVKPMTSAAGNVSDYASRLSALTYNPNEVTSNRVRGSTIQAPKNIRAQTIGAIDDVSGGTPISAERVGTSTWNDAAADKYMSPYIQEVLDRQKEQQLLDWQRTGAVRDTEAAAAGAFGGSRQAVGDYLAEEGLQREMARLQAEGLQSAYENAQGMFTSDQARALEAARANQGAGLTAAQANQQAALQAALANQQTDLSRLTANQQAALEAARANQGAKLSARQGNQQSLNAARLANQQAALDAAKFSEGQRQNAAQLQADALSRAISGQGAASDIYSQAQSDRLAQIDALRNYGNWETQQQQNALDLAYSDWINQRDWDAQKLQMFSSLLRGVPISPEMTTNTYSAQNPVSSALGGTTGLLGMLQYMNQ